MAHGATVQTLKSMEHHDIPCENLQLVVAVFKCGIIFYLFLQNSTLRIVSKIILSGVVEAGKIDSRENIYIISLMQTFSKKYVTTPILFYMEMKSVPLKDAS